MPFDDLVIKAKGFAKDSANIAVSAAADTFKKTLRVSVSIFTVFAMATAVLMILFKLFDPGTKKQVKKHEDSPTWYLNQ